jgi:hypothetical protein
MESNQQGEKGMTELQQLAQELGMPLDSTPEMLALRVVDLSGDGLLGTDDQHELFNRIGV